MFKTMQDMQFKNMPDIYANVFKFSGDMLIKTTLDIQRSRHPFQFILCCEFSPEFSRESPDVK